MKTTHTTKAGERTRPACDCGNINADWHGPRNGRRQFMCDDCWDTQTGKQIADVLMLRHDPEYADRFQTTGGNKTARGIARTVAAILEGTY